MQIDCDIHPSLPGMSALLPYIDEPWREQIVTRGIDGLDLTSYPPRMPLSCRPDWRPERGKPAGDLAQMQAQALDGFGSSIAICNCLYGAQAVYSEDLAAVLCRAMNDWLAAEWLDRDSRLRASIVVPMQSPRFATEEIERRVVDRRFVQVLVLCMGETLLGKRQFWPVYEAAERHGLPIGIHAGSQYRQPPTSIGWPSYHMEYYVAESQAFQSQLLSLIFEGVFTKFPGLRVVLMESGVTWLPPFMWRAVKTWRGVRVEVPWVDRSPAELLREHVRLTVQPFDGPPKAADVERVTEQIGSEKMLLFSTDYPHWQFDGNEAVPSGLSASLVQRMCVDNPLDTYQRLREVVQ